MQIAFPFHLDSRGLVASTDEDSHVRDLIEQVLFTAPGERVNRPEFGVGLRAFVFEDTSNEMLTASQALVQANLQRWLADVIHLESVRVEVDESRLSVTVQYVRLRDQVRQVARFPRSMDP